MFALVVSIIATTCVLTLVVGISLINWFVNGGNTVSISSIDELQIETSEATIYIKGLRSEVSNYWLNQILDEIIKGGDANKK